jgi:hypothetical protein
VGAALGVSVDGLVDEGTPPLALASLRELGVKKSQRSRRVVVAPRGAFREPETEWVTLKPDAKLRLEYPDQQVHIFVVLSGVSIFSVNGQSETVGPEGVVRAVGDVVLESAEGAEILHIYGRNP